MEEGFKITDNSNSVNETSNLGENRNLNNPDDNLDNNTIQEKKNGNDFVDEFPEGDEKKTPENNEGNFVDDYPEDNIESSNDYLDNNTTFKDIENTRDSGGSYKELKDEGWGHNDSPKCEVHHMPAKSASPLHEYDGPAIAMEAIDHRQTASCGSSREAREYQAAQKKLIQEGKMEEAIQMDIDDLKSKFGNKYDKAIGQMLEYAKRKNYI